MILTISDVILTQFPLTRIFDYEYAAVNAILLYFLTGFHGISFIKSSGNAGTGFITSSIIKSLVFFLCIPFIIALLNEILFTSCDFFYGCFFYLVLTVPSAIIGYSTGIYSFGLSRKLTRVIFILISVVIIIIPLLEIYLLPQVYFFNPIAGYFPGNIYDEGITVTTRLINYRIITTLFFLSAGFISLLRIRRETFIYKITLYLIIPVIALLFIYYSPEFGLSTTENSLRNKLKGSTFSEHFEIIYPEKLNKKEVEWLVLKHEYSYQTAAAFLDVDPEKRIISFVFESGEQKKDLFGAGNADVAKPWLNHIYITYDDFEETVKHEIAHCLSSEFGTGFLELAAGLNPAFIEGIAQATDPFYDELSIDFLAKIAYLNDHKENLELLFSDFNFFAVNSTLSYIYSGSFVKFLITTYGINKFKSVYLTGDFPSTYGFPLSKILTEYYSFLEDDSSGFGNKSMADYYFGKPALIYKTCPRSIARDLSKAWGLVRNNDYTGASKIFSSILKLNENYNAVSGLVYIYQKTEQDSLAIELLRSVINNFQNSSYYFNLKFQLADLLIKTGNISEAHLIYREIITEKPETRVTLLASIRLELIKNKKAGIYIRGSKFDRYMILKKLNQDLYFYESFPFLISLSQSLDEDVDLFLNQFGKMPEVNDFSSSYGVYSLSKYLMKNLKFNSARKFAALALRYKDEPYFTSLLNENLSEADWYLKNSEKVFSHTVVK